MMLSPHPRSPRQALAGLQYALGAVVPPNPLVFTWRWRWNSSPRSTCLSFHQRRLKTVAGTLYSKGLAALTLFRATARPGRSARRSKAKASEGPAGEIQSQPHRDLSMLRTQITTLPAAPQRLPTIKRIKHDRSVANDHIPWLEADHH
jgi:hypothetical protein